jgi:hypothetical protein
MCPNARPGMGSIEEESWPAMGWKGRKPECLFNHFEFVVAKSNTDDISCPSLFCCYHIYIYLLILYI